MKTRQKIKGQSLIEFTLLFPILLLLVMGLFDIGRAVFFYATLNNAVREGTRFGIVQSDCDYKSSPGSCSGNYLDSYPLVCQSAASTANIKICNEIKDKFFNMSELSSSTITINRLSSSADKPLIDITIEFLYEPITPGLSLMSNLPIQVNSQMMMTPLSLP